MSREKQIMDLKNSGMGVTAIARELELSLSAVYYYLTPGRRRACIDRLIALKKQNKVMAIQLLGGKCQKCGYDKCSDALVFHHRDPRKKEIRIGGTPHSWKRLEKELKKTVLLCCLCHTELHAGLWTSTDLERLDLKFVPNGQNTGKLILPPSKRRHRIACNS